MQAGEELKGKVEETGQVFKSNVAQLLGVRGGEQTSDKWKIRLQLTKPVTWVPLIWGARTHTAPPAPAACHARMPACARMQAPVTHIPLASAGMDPSTELIDTPSSIVVRAGTPLSNKGGLFPPRQDAAAT